ncbi:MAG: N-acetylmuramoyl-L-alanine amidase [Candidatus Sericytochromatia bacterium]|nr:N-acetylmuramoyl-L-alanine amidase [Candidatus Sericytochromatia bacterium]
MARLPYFQLLRRGVRPAMIAPIFFLALSASVVTSSVPQGASLPEVPALAPIGPRVSLPLTVMASPHQDDRPAGAVIDTIILHDTETPGVTQARTIVNWFQHPRSFVSAHYIIGKAGELIQCVPDERRAWHAGPSKFEGREKVNDFSLGIELVNAQTGSDPFSDAQYRTLSVLTTDLVQRYGIPLERIVGHRHVTNYPGIKKDPADNFDWARYKRGVAGLLAQGTQVVRQVSPATQARQ